MTQEADKGTVLDITNKQRNTSISPIKMIFEVFILIYCW